MHLILVKITLFMSFLNIAGYTKTEVFEVPSHGMHRTHIKKQGQLKMPLTKKHTFDIIPNRCLSRGP